MTTVLTGAAILVGAICVFSVGYLLMLLIFGAARRRVAIPDASEADLPNFVLIVPAHDEELVLAATLDSLRALDYPQDRVETVVIADNCTDSTAAIARGAAATVIERTNTAERGKGYALAYAMRQLLDRTHPADAFAIVDADTWVAPNFLRVMAAEIAARSDSSGLCALQGRYAVLNSGDGWRAALMAGAFDLVNHVKPLGRDARGFTVGLKGNGMAFTRLLLQIAPFTGSSITEDIDYGLDLLLHHGTRVGYAPAAVVRAQMPVTAAQAKSQRARWEGGRYRLMRERAPVLIAAALRRGDPRLFDAGVDLVLPPLAEMAAFLALWAIIVTLGAMTGHLIGGVWVWTASVVMTICGFVGYILGGFRVSSAPAAAYSALLKAPGYALWKFALYAAKPFSRRPGGATQTSDEWVRTERIAVNSPAPASGADDRVAAP